jgi:hypothetical protein
LPRSTTIWNGEPWRPSGDALMTTPLLDPVGGAAVVTPAL